MPAPKHIQEKLRELRRLSTFNDAAFGMPSETVVHNGWSSSDDPGPHPLDDFLKERTRIHRESWILPLIDELIEWAKPVPVTQSDHQRCNFLQREIKNQHKWIQDHGGDLAGYVERYGSRDDPNHYGAGAEAIYAADLAALNKWEDELVSMGR